MKSAQRVLRRAPLSTLLCVLALVCMFILAVWAWLSSNQPSTETTSVTFASEGKTVVVILGGGVTSTGGVPEHTQRRLDIAYKLYQELGPTALFMPLSGGTPHKPNPLDAQGFPVWEATAAAQKLIEMGVPPEQILEESFSLDTIGNAYFLRAVHLDPSNLRSIFVITNTWHMPRTRAIFDFVFSLPRLAGDYERRYIVRGPAATAPYRLTYLSAPDGIADPHLLAVRQQKEASALAQFQDSLPLAVHSFQELHRWIFTQHNAYASKRLLPKEEQTTSNISEELLKTY